jgi:hypothetical protein
MMSVRTKLAPEQQMTIATQAEGRYEYDRGRIVQQMTGGTFALSLVSQRFISAFERRLDANGWAVTQPWSRYAGYGALSRCVGRAATRGIGGTIDRSPGYRGGGAVPHHRRDGLETLQAYIVASRDEARCWLWLRAADGGLPEMPEEIEGLGRAIDNPRLALSIPLEEIYRGIAQHGEGAGEAP